MVDVAASYAIALTAIFIYRSELQEISQAFPFSRLCLYLCTKIHEPTCFGFMVGWSSLLDYLFMPMINILLAKIYFTSLFPGVDPWIFCCCVSRVNDIFNLRGINVVANKYRYCCYSSSCNGGICWFINSWRI